MAKREWTNIQAKEGEIIRLRGEGKTRQEIADIPGLEKGQIKNWINRHNRKGQGKVADLRKTRGREPARTLAEYKYENLLNRDFRAERPNSKWVTDISYIHTGQGVLYLSMIRDLYDNSIVAYRIAAQQTVNLVLDTIRLAMRKEKRRSPLSNRPENSLTNLSTFTTTSASS